MNATILAGSKYTNFQKGVFDESNDEDGDKSIYHVMRICPPNLHVPGDTQRLSRVLRIG